MNENYIRARAQDSDARLGMFTQQLQEEVESLLDSRLAVVATGSYGRSEAHERSDMDLFFILDDVKGKQPVSRLEQLQLFDRVIRASAARNLPAPSNDGEYLTVHSLRQMLDQLGGQTEDADNLFTARMLLLLESRAVCNADALSSIRQKVVQSYFRDFHDHEKDFRPTFLVNDVVRFWKTLCLNYEHRRNRKTDDVARKNAAHVKNLKLKFSRLLTCFSALASIIALKTPSESAVIEVLEMSPVDRLLCMKERADVASQVAELLDDYAWFLERTADREILSWMQDGGNRDAAFARGRRFGARCFDLLQACAADPVSLRYVLL